MFDLSFGERQAEGLSIRESRQVLKKCVDKVPDFKELEPQHQAMVFMAIWAETAPLVNGTQAGLDPDRLDKIFAFLEKWLPLILKLFGLAW